MYGKSFAKSWLALGLTLTMLLGTVAPGIAMAEIVQGGRRIVRGAD
ncbi:hypothetical protein [Paenibacillus sp. 1P07SE]